ncbi:hypothetical protein QX227_09250 [Pectobacterium aroidearum]
MDFNQKELDFINEMGIDFESLEKSNLLITTLMNIAEDYKKMNLYY